MKKDADFEQIQTLACPLLALLKQGLDSENYHYFLKYKHFLVLNHTLDDFCVCDTAASKYFQDNGPGDVFENPHLYGFVELIRAHSRLTREPQQLLLKYPFS